MTAREKLATLKRIKIALDILIVNTEGEVKELREGEIFDHGFVNASADDAIGAIYHAISDDPEDYSDPDVITNNEPEW